MSVRLLTGDSLTVLRTLPDVSVNCCVTSPPYFGLRKYGNDPAELGQELSPEQFVANQVAVFREARRVLRDDGTLWVNIGDSYAGSGRGGNSDAITGRGKDESKKGRGSTLSAGLHADQVKSGALGRAWVPPPAGLKQKDMIGIPWMLAFALRADGWYLRQDIIWSKPNPMPESVTDRCTKAHEYLFLLSKSPRYYFDQSAILEPCSPNTHARLSQDVQNQIGSERVPGKTNGRMKATGRKFDPAAGNKNNASFDAAMAIMPDERNKRSVWTVTTQPFKEAHFATFPTALVEPCILAGCPVGGTVLDCFGGAGTTGMVADRLQRHAILIDLYPKFTAMSRKRISGDSPLFAEVA